MPITSFPCEVCCGGVPPFTECQPPGGCAICPPSWQADLGYCNGADCGEINGAKHIGIAGFGIVCQNIASDCHRVGNNCICTFTFLGCYFIGWPCCTKAIHFYQTAVYCGATFSYGGCTYGRTGDRALGGTGMHECEYSGPAT